MGRRLRLGFLAALAVLAVAHGAAWLWAVREVEKGYAAWADRMRAEGWSVAAGASAWGGWPFAARLVLPDLRLAVGAAGSSGGFAWRAERVELELAASRPRLLRVCPRGAQSLRFADGPPLPLAAGRLELDVPLDGRETVDVRAEELRVGLPWGDLTAMLLLARVAPLAATVEASDVGLPDGLLGTPLGGSDPAPGPAVERVRFDAALTLPVPPGPSPARRAAAWQAAGGRVRVAGLDARWGARWGALGVTGDGEAWLDPALQPVARARLRLSNHAAALDAMAASGALTPGAAAAAKAVLGLMAEPRPGGSGVGGSGVGGPSVQVPLRLEGGAIGMGRVPLLRLPALVWPDG